MKKLITIITLIAFTSGCASLMPSVRKAELDAEAKAEEADKARAHAERMSKLELAKALVSKGKDVPDSAVFREINATSKETNKYDASIARSKAVANTVSAVVWPLAMVAGIRSIFGAIAGIGRTEIKADGQSSVNVGRDGSFNEGTGGDIRVGSPNTTTTNTATQTESTTSNSNEQSNSSGDNN